MKGDAWKYELELKLLENRRFRQKCWRAVGVAWTAYLMISALLVADDLLTSLGLEKLVIP